MKDLSQRISRWTIRLPHQTVVTRKAEYTENIQCFRFLQMNIRKRYLNFDSGYEENRLEAQMEGGVVILIIPMESHDDQKRTKVTPHRTSNIYIYERGYFETYG